jgi:hypothetical protein
LAEHTSDHRAKELEALLANSCSSPAVAPVAIVEN